MIFKKIIKSKLLKLLITVILIYFAFRQVDVVSILKQLVGIKFSFLLLLMSISILSLFLISYRWSLLLIKKPKFEDVLNFVKSTWSASFYGLFVPTSLAGDVFKWIIIDEKYPNISKSKLAGSILLDRFIGMTMFVFLGFVMQFGAKNLGVEIPGLVILSFWVLFIGCIVIYALIFGGKTEFIFRIKWLKKIENISELINRENRVQIIKSIMISLFSDFFWIFQMWIVSQYFGANLSFISILIFLPVISTILILPISIAGFGAREQLFLYFFVNQNTSAESVLLTSAVLGTIGVINSLLGGLIVLTPEFKNSRKNLTFK